MKKPWTRVRHGALFTLNAIPAGAYPDRWRWRVLCEGQPCGFARTKLDAEQRIERGHYDDAIERQQPRTALRLLRESYPEE